MTELLKSPQKRIINTSYGKWNKLFSGRVSTSGHRQQQCPQHTNTIALTAIHILFYYSFAFFYFTCSLLIPFFRFCFYICGKQKVLMRRISAALWTLSLSEPQLRPLTMGNKHTYTNTHTHTCMALAGTGTVSVCCPMTCAFYEPSSLAVIMRPIRTAGCLVWKV